MLWVTILACSLSLSFPSPFPPPVLGTDGAGGLWQVWAKPLAGDATAALLINRNASAAVDVTFDFASCNVSKRATVVKDLWTGKVVPGSHSTSWGAEIAPHAHRLVKVSPPANTEL